MVSAFTHLKHPLITDIVERLPYANTIRQFDFLKAVHLSPGYCRTYGKEDTEKAS